MKKVSSPDTAPKFEIKEQKDGLMVVAPQVELGGRSFARAMVGSQPVRTVVVQEFARSSVSANSALNTVYPIDLALGSDIASWLNLFDEMRMDSLHAMFVVTLAYGASTSNPAYLPMSASFDPSQNTAITGHAANLKADHFIGPFLPLISNGVSAANTQYMAGPVNTTSRGHYALSSGPLMRNTLPISSGGVLLPTPVQGAWVPTTTGTAVGGYFKLYAEAPGASLTWGSQLWCRINCEFRVRG